mmetsp:Transcript_39991/g.61196  ORF Transcript_39991/g.61196 Transcript_39991/m.61196 type:complete len:86 (+) Transcript_39991:1406-1663(+)
MSYMERNNIVPKETGFTRESVIRRQPDFFAANRQKFLEDMGWRHYTEEQLKELSDELGLPELNYTFAMEILKNKDRYENKLLMKQ